MPCGRTLSETGLLENNYSAVNLILLTLSSIFSLYSQGLFQRSVTSQLETSLGCSFTILNSYAFIYDKDIKYYKQYIEEQYCHLTGVIYIFIWILKEMEVSCHISNFSYTCIHYMYLVNYKIKKTFFKLK